MQQFMKVILPLAAAVIFIVYGIISIFSPTTIKNHMNKSHTEGLKDFGASNDYAEKYVKKNLLQYDSIYRVIGIVMMICGGLLFYAVVKTLLKS